MIVITSFMWILFYLIVLVLATLFMAAALVPAGLLVLGVWLLETQAGFPVWVSVSLSFCLWAWLMGIGGSAAKRLSNTAQ